MQEILQTRDVKSPRQKMWLRLLIMIAAIFFVSDRLFKAWAVAELTISGSFLRFELFRNEGSIFSFPVPNGVMELISVVLFVSFATWLFRSIRHREFFVSVGLLYILLGAISNIMDRFIFDAVIDYMIFWNRSAINIADIMIVAGILILVFNKPKRKVEEVREI